MRSKSIGDIFSNTQLEFQYYTMHLDYLHGISYYILAEWSILATLITNPRRIEKLQFLHITERIYKGDI